ncbi:MAG: DUF4432 family protein, partial [Acidimicrobiales bacterium]
IGSLPARLVGYGERWDGDECVLWAEGEIHQSAVFGEDLVLHRRIEAGVGASRLTVHDEVENAGHTRVSHMFLYHCNVGYPVVDAGARIVATSTSTRTDYPVPVAGYDHLTGPVPDAVEACFEHELRADHDGRAWAGIINPERGIGVYQAFPLAAFPHHTVWRMLGEGTYACALEPSTNRDAGRWDAIERGELQWLRPGERRGYDLEIGALVGPEEIGMFLRHVERVVEAAPGEDALDAPPGQGSA